MSGNRRSCLASVMLVALMAGPFAGTTPATATPMRTSSNVATVGRSAPAVTGTGVAIPHRYVVVLKKRVSTQGVGHARRVMTGRGAVVLRTYRGSLRGFSARMSPRTLRAVRRLDMVKMVVADRRLRVTGSQGGPPWGLDRIDQRSRPLNGSYVYDATGAGVTAYVVDTGIRATHVEFSGRVHTGYTAVNDGRGTDDCQGHGTHVAGTIGGSTFGVAKGVTLVPVRVLGCDGSGSTSQVIAGLDWVSRHRTGPSVVNMSLGGGADSALDEAVRRTVASGVTVVVAAGNGYGSNACSVSPARAASALTVASTTSGDARSSFSNVGSCVDLFAPGSDVLSASNASDRASTVKSGTSMATPHVTGAVALWLQAHPTATPTDVTAALLGASTANAVADPGTGTPNRLLYSRFPVSTPAPTNPRIAISQGGAAPAGYWYAVSLSGFAPGSSVTLTCRDSVDPQGFYSQTFTISGSGTAGDSTLCYSGDHPDHWVTGGGVESNHLAW